MDPAKIKFRILASAFGAFVLFMLVCNLVYFQQNYREISSQMKTTYALKNDAEKASAHSRLFKLQSLKNSFVETLELELNSVLEKNHCLSFFIQIYGLTQKLFDPILIKDEHYSIARLNNNHLSIICKKEDCSRYAQKMVRFNQILSEKNIPFVFVLAPSKIHQRQPMLETGITDYSNENADSFLEILRKGNIEILDCREILKDDPETHYNLFYRTDTHWKTEYAFLAYQNLAPIFQKHGFEVSPDSLRKENYELIYYGQKNDLGKRLGSGYLTPDAHQYMQPKWETSLQLVPHVDHSDYSGKYSIIKLEKSSSNASIFNQKAHKQMKVFFFSDSFGRNFSSFLPFTCSHLEIRILNEYSGNLLQEIEEFQPDLVIGMFTARDTYFHCDKIELPEE